jgi:hypothetical protein
MGVNAQTSVPAFTAGQVLTAAEMTEVNTGIPVFATTVTRDAAFGGAGEKVLAEGQYAYIEASNATQYYDGAAWVAVGVTPGLVPITPTSISVGSGTASSAGNGEVTFTGVGTNLSLNGVFSATYTNYLILLSEVTASGTANFQCRLRSGTTDNTNANYDSASIVLTQAGTLNSSIQNNATQWAFDQNTYTYQYFALTLFSPFVTGFTGMTNSITESTGTTSFYTTLCNGQNQESYSANGITFVVNGGGTSSGKVSVYGYTI